MWSLWMTAGRLFMSIYITLSKKKWRERVSKYRGPVPHSWGKAWNANTIHWLKFWSVCQTNHFFVNFNQIPKNRPVSHFTSSFPSSYILPTVKLVPFHVFFCHYLRSVRVAHYSFAGKETGASPHYRVNKFGCSRGLPLWDADYN